MRKYVTLFGLSWQKQLEVRSDFIFERARSISLLVSLYFLWTALLSNREAVAGYERAEILTYVLLATLLRAFVLAAISDRLPSEIAKGHLSDLLLRPISPLGYWATQDMASKFLNIISALAELGLFILLLRPPFLFPASFVETITFLFVTVSSMILYFQMSYFLGGMGFWTSQSWGPRFCFEVILEFCAGSYFPIDILPAAVQSIIKLLPFPYLIYQPLSIYLGRLSQIEILQGLMIQWAWIGLMAFFIHLLWRRGLKHYAAEGR